MPIMRDDMMLSPYPGLNLAYCMNVHPGESFQDQWDAARDYALVLRDEIASGQPFGLGLRLSHQAAREALAHDAARAFAAWCSEHDVYVFTINAFPYGNFHSAPVKAGVYRPDWTTEARRDYTMAAADALAVMLPHGVAGSISTVPCWYASDYADQSTRRQAMAATIEHLIDTARHLDHISKISGKEITLGLEPEPGCFLETSDDVVTFFTESLFKAHGGKVEELLRRRIGVCIDTCHCALAFERPADVINKLRHHQIRMVKIQLSAAPAVRASHQSIPFLANFAEPVYFHQTASRLHDGTLQKWSDLEPALVDLAGRNDWHEARTHFHVPLHWSGHPPLATTRDTMDDAFWELVKGGATDHLEIETYTFHVLPSNVPPDSLVESIRKEYEWVLGRLKSDMS